MCWVYSVCGQLAVQVWSSRERAGLEVRIPVPKTRCLPPERDSPIVSSLPSRRPGCLSRWLSFEQAREPAPGWPALRRLGGQGMTCPMASDEERLPLPSCHLSASEMLHSPLPCTGCKPSGDIPDVFISYRRNSGSQLAR